MLGLVRKCRRSVKVTAVKLYITSYMGMICSTRTTNDIIRALAGSRSDDISRFTLARLLEKPDIWPLPQRSVLAFLSGVGRTDDMAHN